MLVQEFSIQNIVLASLQLELGEELGSMAQQSRALALVILVALVDVFFLNLASAAALSRFRILHNGRFSDGEPNPRFGESAARNNPLAFTCKSFHGAVMTCFRADRSSASSAVIVQAPPSSFRQTLNSLVHLRGGFTDSIPDSQIVSFVSNTVSTFKSRFSELNSLQSDTAILLATVTVAATASKLVNVAPIIGLIAAGATLGPRGRNLFSMPQTIESLGNMGILLFLFEIGMGLNFDRFVCLRHDIFGLGIWQLALTSWAGYLVCQLMGLTSRSSLAVALAMAMSSTAFVLQILTNKNEMNSPIGRASFGMLLLQDVAILPILLLFDFMTKGGSVATQLVGNLQNLLAAAVGLAVIYGTSTIVFGPMFPLLNRSDLDTKVPTSLALVLIASLWTQLCGLSESLGAFLGGIFLSGTRYEHDIAQALAPMRTLLMGLFFLHVGFDIDMFVICETPRVFALLLVGLYLIKSSIIAALSHLGGLGIKDSIRCGLLNGQAGEFALVVLEAAHRLGIIDGPTRRFCLTLAAVSMAGTPLIDSLASRVLGVQSDLSAPSGPGLQVSSEIGARIKARVTRLTHTDHGM